MQLLSKYVQEEGDFIKEAPFLKFLLTNYLPLSLILFFLNIGAFSYAQNSTYSFNDTAEVYILIDSANTLRRKDKALAIELSVKSMELADKISEPLARIRARLNFADNLLTKFKPEGKQAMIEALAINKNRQFPQYLAASYNNLGLNYRMEGKLDSALFCHRECEKIAININHATLQWKSKMGMVRIYQGKNEPETVEKYLLEAWDLVQNHEIRFGKGMTIYHLADLYFQTKNHGEFARWQDEWQSYIMSRNKSIDDVISPSHFNLSLFFDDFPKTLARFDTVLAYHQGRKDTARIGITYWELGKNYSKEAQYQKAVEAFVQAQPYVEKKMGQYFQVAFFQDKYNTAKLANNIPIALSSFEKYQQLVNNARKSEMDNRIAELEVKYETAEKENKIAKTTLQRNWILASLGLFLLLGGTLIWSMRKRIQINKKLAVQESELQNQKIYQLKQEHQLSVVNAMLEGEEQERARIAKELHDGLGGLLTTVKAHFTTIGVQNNPELYQKTNDLLDTACKEVRTISHNMMPHSLMLSGLQGAMEDLGASLNFEDINCDFETVSWNDAILPMPKQIMLYRIVQELVQNIRKHADAKQVLIQLMRHQNELTLIVEDDGKGFSTHQKSDGIGLKNIQSRVQFLKGIIDIDTVEREGTTTTIRIPLDVQKNDNVQKTEIPIL